MVGRARGYDATIITPDDMAAEKLHALRSLGADVEQARPASIVDKKQFVNIARQRALDFSSASSPSLLSASEDSIAVLTDSAARGFFADQFENKSNYDAHFDGTGPELWRQMNGNVKAFVSGAGTGGTIAGVGRFLKSMEQDIIICLADPQGSGLYIKVKHGVMFDQREKEGTKRRHQVDTVVEGIGINRLTQNIELALPLIDDAVRCPCALGRAPHDAMTVVVCRLYRRGPVKNGESPTYDPIHMNYGSNEEAASSRAYFQRLE
ncbi:tryptophan synthase beta subunit-like PLP-dependent enzyme [Mycena alexandri]|uniref:Tryptophan synthase beta subunit-like PLP-dependent enzyme n=1 Tax=Mycena alexandri TaxID=1745969 RepID=A0AAD6SMR6_9AGAR|nr:tryptophan synthase beta subunit-like PLP-dependent enzyme [Mycena alexandri]